MSKGTRENCYQSKLLFVQMFLLFGFSPVCCSFFKAWWTDAFLKMLINLSFFRPLPTHPNSWEQVIKEKDKSSCWGVLPHLKWPLILQVQKSQLHLSNWFYRNLETGQFLGNHLVQSSAFRDKRLSSPGIKCPQSLPSIYPFSFEMDATSTPFQFMINTVLNLPWGHEMEQDGILASKNSPHLWQSLDL